eukprot:gnl/Chilomastix_cuspidata/3958.p1 GENE.gnl/Chilomastix_cuspidata/3958~~gnl/Chilomastix_cuspidata/3958.p1  ORF type:complete len:505 (-),score=105.70 gnl/Chilomastix_cuspidata/3958:359-1873(-)
MQVPRRSARRAPPPTSPLRLSRAGHALQAGQEPPACANAPDAHDAPHVLLTILDVQRGAAYARAELRAATLEADSAEFLYDERLARYAVNDTPVEEAVALHENVSIQSLGLLAPLAGAARTALVASGVGYSARTRCTITTADEAAAREAFSSSHLAAASTEANRAAQLRSRATRLSRVVGLTAVPEDASAQRLLRATVAESCGPADRVEDFAAFPGVWNMRCVRRLLKGNAGGRAGPFASEKSFDVDGIPADALGKCIASLSTCGTLCVRSWRRGDVAKLHLYSLASSRRTVLRTPELEWACVYDGELFLGVRELPFILYARLDLVRRGLQPAAFDRFAVPGRVATAATDRAADGWIVFHIGYGSNKIVRVDLRARACEVIACDCRFASIGGLSGVRVPGVLCVAQDSVDDESTLAVFADGHTQEVAHGLYDFPVGLPSASCPANAARMAVTDAYTHNVLYGRAWCLVGAARARWLSLVRLYKDVFMCYDSRSRRWRALRITVP